MNDKMMWSRKTDIQPIVPQEEDEELCFRSVFFSLSGNVDAAHTKRNLSLHEQLKAA